MSHTGIGQRGHHGPLSWLGWGAENWHHAQIMLSYPIGDEDNHIAGSPVFFGLVWVTNSTLVFPLPSREEMQMKKPSDTMLNWRTAKHGSFWWRNIPPLETNTVDLYLLWFLHRSMLWRVMTSVRENWFGEESCWLNVWYGNNWGSGPLVYDPELVLSYWRVKNNTGEIWTDQMVCWMCLLSGSKGYHKWVPRWAWM